MTNAEWMIKNGYKFSDLCCCFDSSSGDIIISLYNKILVRRVRRGYISFNDFLKRWLDKEHEEYEEESFLNNAEKKYLRAVIKPFRDQVRSITKNPKMNGKGEYIVIDIGFQLENRHKFFMFFPDFKSNTMYKGMELGKEYTLEELGL